MSKWISPKPKACDICHTPFADGDKFIDGATRMGPWGCLCTGCHVEYGRGLGVGRGQLYDWTTCEKEQG